jgi:hypothetical protein
LTSVLTSGISFEGKDVVEKQDGGESEPNLQAGEASGELNREERDVRGELSRDGVGLEGADEPAITAGAWLVDDETD